MENTNKKTAEQREIEKQERKVQRELLYKSRHFVIKITDGDIVSYIPLKGCYTSNSVVFTFDGNSYICVVDDTHGNAFIKTYTRCKETAKDYCIKSQLAKNNQKYCFELISESCVDVNGNVLTYKQIYDKAIQCVGYRESRTKRVLEITECLVSRAGTVAAKKAKAEARAKAKAEETKAEAV